MLWWLSIASALGAPDLEARAHELRTALPEGYTVLVEPPWVVVGDEPPERVRARSEQTVRWATERLEAQLFSVRPKETITLWMFSSADTYEHGSISLFDHAPDSPGYFLDGQLVMNVAIGDGIVIHEMVHAYVEGITPAAPSWINEGLASLYEDCEYREGRLSGRNNRRLVPLQAAIRADGLPPLEDLLRADRFAFHGYSMTTNYATARYLMMWLQEQGTLEQFWHTWQADYREDHDGIEALRTVIGTDDLGAWDKQWRAWVLGLSPPL